MSALWSKRSWLRVFALMLAVVSLSACYDDPFSPYWDRGTYYLVSANNRYVPATVVGGPGNNLARLEVTRGTLTLRRDHSYQMVVDIREWTSGGVVVESSKVYAGRYENDGRAIYLDYYDRDYYPETMVANWRNGRVEVVVPAVDGRTDVLCVFTD